ncbi:hypothetical protein CR513_16861, partial [Mucuna pruriens]
MEMFGHRACMYNRLLLVNVHILRKGFTPRYWTSHGERIPRTSMNVDVDVDMHSVPCSSQQWGYEDGNIHQDMVFDVAGVNSEQYFVQNEEEPPNMEAAKF